MKSDQHVLFEEVEAALNQIRPYLEADGGNVTLIEITPDNEAMVAFQGACKSCSMSDMTLKAGIEETIKKAVPSIKSVISVKQTDEPIQSDESIELV